MLFIKEDWVGLGRRKSNWVMFKGRMEEEEIACGEFRQPLQIVLLKKKGWGEY